MDSSATVRQVTAAYYPGDWHLDVRRLVCEERFAAAWIDARVGEERQDACVW